MSKVILSKLVKKYDALQVIHAIDLIIESGEFCVFVGPSGCGKSTLLRMIAGLEETTQGHIFIADREVTQVDASERGIAMVFQSYALYPHMTVRQNMSFGMKMTGVDAVTIDQKVTDVADVLKLEPYMNRKPKALSGGQRQRVAIGRALVRDPKVFLFDEPLSNLDAELRVDMRVEIARLHQELDTTMIYVTHDQVEAMTLADKIVVLRAGNIEQTGAPMALYDRPVNKFVAGFIGSPAMNFTEVLIDDGQVSTTAFSDVKLSIDTPYTGKAWLGIRPEHIQIDPKGNSFTVYLVEALGGVTYVYARTAEEKFIIEQKGNSSIKRGDHIGIILDQERLHFFDYTTEKRL